MFVLGIETSLGGYGSPQMDVRTTKSVWGQPSPSGLPALPSL